MASTIHAASGLRPPELSFYVAEAGKGGPGPCVASPEGGASCYGASGAITRIWQGTQQRLIAGLPSTGAKGGKDGPAGANAGGPHDVAVDKQGNLGVVIGLGANPQERAKLGMARRRLRAAHHPGRQGRVAHHDRRVGQ